MEKNKCEMKIERGGLVVEKLSSAGRFGLQVVAKPTSVSTNKPLPSVHMGRYYSYDALSPPGPSMKPPLQPTALGAGYF